MPHARGGTLTIMGFAGNTREQKVIASPRGCAKERSVLIFNADFLFPAQRRQWEVWPSWLDPGRARMFRRTGLTLIVLVCGIGEYKSYDL
jgi:hypothetical protein